jgi:hypothetical protein
VATSWSLSPSPETKNYWWAESQEKHPSALEWIEAVVAAAKGKQIVMFLDYDGTLSPIVEDPDSAVMTEEVSFFFVSVLFTS